MCHPLLSTLGVPYNEFFIMASVDAVWDKTKDVIASLAFFCPHFSLSSGQVYLVVSRVVVLGNRVFLF